MMNMPGTRGPINRDVDDLNRTRFLGSEGAASTPSKAERTLQSPEEKSRRVLGNALTFDEAERALTYLEGDVVDAKGQLYSKDQLQKVIAKIKEVVEEGYPVSPDFLASTVPNVLGLPDAVRKVVTFAGEMMVTPEQKAAAEEQAALVQKEKMERLFGHADTFDDIRSVLKQLKGIKNNQSELSQEALLEIVQYIDDSSLTEPEKELSSYIEKTPIGLGFRDALRRAYQQKRRLAQYQPAIKPPQPLPEQPVFDRRKLIEDKKLSVEQRLQHVQTFQELELVLQDSNGMSGSREWFSPFDLLQRVNAVKQAVLTQNHGELPNRITAVTRSEGLQAAVQRAVQNAFQGRM